MQKRKKWTRTKSTDQRGQTRARAWSHRTADDQCLRWWYRHLGVLLFRLGGLTGTGITEEAVDKAGDSREESRESRDKYVGKQEASKSCCSSRSSGKAS